MCCDFAGLDTGQETVGARSCMSVSKDGIDPTGDSLKSLFWGFRLRSVNILAAAQISQYLLKNACLLKFVRPVASPWRIGSATLARVQCYPTSCLCEI